MFSYLQQLKLNKVDDQDIISKKVYKVLGHYNLLFDQETYTTKSIAAKWLNFFVTACPFVHWISLFVYLVFNLRSVAIDTFCEEFALSIGGLLVAYRLFAFNRNREQISELVQELNTLNRRFRKESEDLSRLSHRIHYWQLIIGTCMTVVGGGIGLPQAAFAIYSRQLYYDHIFPVDTSEFSVAFFVIWAFQFFTVCSCSICSCLQECILIDWFVQLSFTYYALNQKAEELRRVSAEELKEEDEYEKLIEIIRISQQLERLATRLNAFINLYLSLIFSLFYVAVSISIFVLISVAGQGAVFIIKSSLYPIFAVGVMVLWCIIGQILADQANKLSYSLYKCNWTDAPRKFRQVLFMLMIRSRITVEIDARPFYRVNLFMFTDFLKRTYCLMALLLDMRNRQ